MGRKTTRRPGRRQETSRPSIFFIIALVIGLILFFVMAVVMIRRPATKSGAHGTLPQIALIASRACGST